MYNRPTIDPYDRDSMRKALGYTLECANAIRRNNPEEDLSRNPTFKMIVHDAILLWVFIAGLDLKRDPQLIAALFTELAAMLNIKKMDVDPDALKILFSSMMVKGEENV